MPRQRRTEGSARTDSAGASGAGRPVERAVPAADERAAASLQRNLQAQADGSSRAAGLAAMGALSRKAAGRQPVQAVMAGPVAQLERTVTNSQAKNMRESLARVFGGDPSRYQIDQESGTTFNDNNGKDTTGHHGVTVTDTLTGKVYSCDFHNNGNYYTRG